MGLRHKDTATQPDDSTPRVQPSEWNKDHIFLAMAEPADGDVPENTAYPWMSSVDGSIMVKINFGGVIKTATLIPFPILS